MVITLYACKHHSRSCFTFLIVLFSPNFRKCIQEKGKFPSAYVWIQEFSRWLMSACRVNCRGEGSPKIIYIAIYLNYYIITLLYETINLNLFLINSSHNGYKMINHVKKKSSHCWPTKRCSTYLIIIRSLILKIRKYLAGKLVRKRKQKIIKMLRFSKFS